MKNKLMLAGKQIGVVGGEQQRNYHEDYIARIYVEELTDEEDYTEEELTGITDPEYRARLYNACLIDEIGYTMEELADDFGTGHVIIICSEYYTIFAKDDNLDLNFLYNTMKLKGLQGLEELLMELDVHFSVQSFPPVN